MKSVKKNEDLLRVLKKYSNTKIWKGIIENCDTSVIQALAEILHNVLVGNLELDSSSFAKLNKYKRQLRKLHSCIRTKKVVRERRKYFANQRGGFWPLLLEAALSGLAAYGGQKLAQYGEEKK